MPLPVKAPRPSSPAPTVTSAPAVAQTRPPGEHTLGPGHGATRNTVAGAAWFPGGNAATGAMLSGSPPGLPGLPTQILVAGQSLIGNAAVASRAISRPPVALTPEPPL